MSFGPFLFGAPGALLALLALPVLYFIMRATPPPPQREQFPPARLLEGLHTEDQSRERAPWWRVVPALAAPLAPSSPVFVPDARRPSPTPTWWSLGPRCIRRWLALLGFEQERLTYHFQKEAAGVVPMYTIVAKRVATPAT